METSESDPNAFQHHDLRHAMERWRRILGPDQVHSIADAQERFGADTDRGKARVLAAVRPRSSAEVQEVVRVARDFRVPLYPISTGRNWGYGTATPPGGPAVIVDLGGMNRIVDLNPELGTVTVEPGVTQADLDRLLTERSLPFMVPTTGAGPQCSLIGNALERGYGVTPHADHFGALTNLKAVLPDGSLYRSALSELGAEGLDRSFKWGVGPYLDGLFSQGGFGIVTEATLALARRPERMLAFFFWVDDEQKLEEVVVRVRELVASVGGMLGGINLMNARRVLSMLADRPSGAEVLCPEEVERERRRNRLPAWMGMGAIYGRREVVSACRRIVRKELRPVSRRMHFVSPGLVQTAQRVARLLPRWALGRASEQLDAVGEAMRLMHGHPSKVALALCYEGRIGGGASPDPARDGRGLLWYAPLVPARPGDVRRYTDMVERVCLEHGIDPLITLTTLSNRCFDSTVPILFDKANASSVERAHACHARLFEEGQSMGFLPYRVGVRGREQVVRPDSPFFQLATRLKRTLDPDDILAPGRYALTRTETATSLHHQEDPMYGLTAAE